MLGYECERHGVFEQMSHVTVVVARSRILTAQCQCAVHTQSNGDVFIWMKYSREEQKNNIQNKRRIGHIVASVG